MTKPIESIEEIILLQPGIQLSIPRTISLDEAVREFQLILGRGAFCEELDFYTLEAAEGWKNEVMSEIEWDEIDNQTGLDSLDGSGLWPLFRNGNGYNFYYYPPEKCFIEHTHDPDVLKMMGFTLAQAVNAALDSTFHFIPEDIPPVYWKPYGSNFLRFSGYRSIITPNQMFDSIENLPASSHRHITTNCGNLIWANHFAHLHYTVSDGEGSDLGPSVHACFEYSQKSLEIEKILQALRLTAAKHHLDVYERTIP